MNHKKWNKDKEKNIQFQFVSAVSVQPNREEKEIIINNFVHVGDRSISSRVEFLSLIASRISLAAFLFRSTRN